MKNKITNFIYDYKFSLSLGNFLSIFFESILIGLFAVFLTFKFLQLNLSNLLIPFSYQGDSFHVFVIIKSLLENNWYLFNDHLGAPFGLEHYDFPIPDGGMLLLIKIISYFFSNIYLIHNLVFLGSFFITAAVSYAVFCRFGVIKIFAFSGAILFTFIPFHFIRLPHLFYTWYFSIPIYIFLCIKIMSDEDKNQPISWQSIVLLALCASFGLYYAFFASVLLFFSAIYFFESNNLYQIKKALIFIVVIYITLAVNLSPNILQKILTSSNPEIAIRNPAESENYGLRMTQLVLPYAAHRVNWLAEKTQNYNNSAPVINENTTATLGLVGSIGLFFLLISIFKRDRTLFGIKIIPQLANLNLACFLLGTIGGLGTLFALLISPMIRGYNRISVFIAFLSITTAILVFQKIIADRNFKNPNIAYIITTLLILFIGLFDQTSPAFIPNYAAINQEYEHDARFVLKIEASVSPGTMIYQLPYIEFPEKLPLYHEGHYGLFRGYLHSRTLKWSYGAMGGREGDLWLRAMSALPIEEQVQKIAASGFGGIYVDRRAFNDHAVSLESQLTLLVPAAPIISEDGNLAFYRIQPTGNKPVAMMMMPPLLLGKGFYGWEGEVGKFVWSSGDADLWLSNPDKTPINIKLIFKMDTLLQRKVLISVEGNQETTEKTLQPQEPQLVNISVKLKPGKTRIKFSTNTPAQLPDNGDPRKLAFNLYDIHMERFFNGD